ncbi:replication factor C subunit 4 [Podila horticola]|nr:replication factor C subunit 4 [Podila horticola]
MSSSSTNTNTAHATAAQVASLNAQFKGNVDSYELPWVEKYRPEVLKDIVGNEETVERLQLIANKGNMPHMIISGSPGIGKTTSVLCLAHELLGSAFKEGVLELNASDDRGIDVVRNKIKTFAQKKVTLPPGRHKIVILDEADSMTAGAQQALRRTMEIYSNSTRFALACNQSSKIIEPIQSRCAMLRYSKLTDKQVLHRLREICDTENVKYSAEGLEALIFTAEGDMRQAINNLQSTWSGFGYVNDENVFKVCDQPHPVVVNSIIASCLQAHSTNALQGIHMLWKQGYSAVDIITTLFRVVKFYEGMPEYMKLDYIKEIGMTHMKILEGVTSLVQLGGLISRLCKLSMNAKSFEV